MAGQESPSIERWPSAVRSHLSDESQGHAGVVKRIMGARGRQALLGDGDRQFVPDIVAAVWLPKAFEFGVLFHGAVAFADAYRRQTVTRRRLPQQPPVEIHVIGDDHLPGQKRRQPDIEVLEARRLDDVAVADAVDGRGDGRDWHGRPDEFIQGFRALAVQNSDLQHFIVRAEAGGLGVQDVEFARDQAARPLNGLPAMRRVEMSGHCLARFRIARTGL